MRTLPELLRDLVANLAAGGLAAALFLSGGCGRKAYNTPPPLPEGASPPAAPNVQASTDAGFQLRDGRVVPPPSQVEPALWADPGVQVYHVNENPGPSHVRMNVQASPSAAAQKVEQSLVPKGWARSGEIESNRVVRRSYEMADGSLAEMVVLDIGGGRTEIQLTVSPMLDSPAPLPPRAP